MNLLNKNKISIVNNVSKNYLNVFFSNSYIFNNKSSNNYINKATLTSSAQYCLDSVKKHDYENFLCTLLLKGSVRRTAIAIRAFNIEIALISGRVSDDKIGLMRLKFWEEALDTLYDKNSNSIPDHPVIKELKIVTDQTKLTKRYFKRLITCRTRPKNLPFLSINELDDYNENSVSSIYLLLLESINMKNVNVDHTVSHLGKSQGIINFLRSIHIQNRTNVIPVPTELLVKHKVSQERIFRDKQDDKGVEDCIFDLATVAHQHLNKARSINETLPKTIKTFLLPGIAIERYLERLRKSNFHLTNKRLSQRDTMLPLAYLINQYRGKF